MRNNRLISMVDFVLSLELGAKDWDTTNSKVEYYNRMISYANFLSQPIKLGMFIPCGENDEPLEEPIVGKTYQSKDNIIDNWICGKSRVLFEGFSDKEINVIRSMINSHKQLDTSKNFKVESLLNLTSMWDIESTITDNGLKTIYG